MSSTALIRPAALRLAARSAQGIGRSGAQRMRYSSRPEKESTHFKRIFALTAVGVAGALAAYNLTDSSKKEPAAGPKVAEIEFEQPRQRSRSKEEARDLVSSQHLQVKRSWESPGVYAWGSNTGRVVAPDSDEAIVKNPHRIAYFDNMRLRDLKLDRNFGVAVTEKGDLVQWGAAFSQADRTPVVTLKGRDIAKVTLSRDRIIALSRDGSVLSIPVAKSDQASGAKESTSSAVPFWSGVATVSYRTLRPKLARGERVTDVESGLEHCLLLTNKGRVFSAASSSEGFPSRGQLGVPGLTWDTRPEGAYDQPHEVAELANRAVKQIAAGDYHSLALLDDGLQLAAWGDNSSGQLGGEPNREAPFVEKPRLLSVPELYKRRGKDATGRATLIAAGGANSYFTADAVEKDAARAVASVDTWACGQGLQGNLGSGKWTHVSLGPTRIKSLSGLREFDETTGRVRPIRVKRLSVGSTHAAAVLDNATAAATDKGSAYDTNVGADVLWWGGNEHYQLGTGKRNNLATPTYIAPLDADRGAYAAGAGAKAEDERFQIAPRTARGTVAEQRVECGRFVSAVYSAA